MVTEQGIAVLKTVTTGLGSEDLVEVTSGVEAGDRVVVRGAFNLRDGDRVQVSGQGGNG